ncbi:iron-containing alcohol dehydrogenase [Halalkalibacterium ligniniphilum]|uniref:iron-containing alcohol dehydrogenase n=1 Tax=Halalkalibacterium ligniniphilum TaxID=1134413 RepID=UPI00034C274B|nr:iron-containing alcohol dehydrogenase [Halalkalibacterium ligniniphilum]
MSISEFKIANKLITGKEALTRLADELNQLGCKNPLVVTDEILEKVGVVASLDTYLKGFSYGLYTGVKPEPEIALVQECVDVINEGGHDGLIALGGGSAIDIAKSASVLVTNNQNIEDLFGTDLVEKPGLPLVAIPTTAGTGSEVTNVAILSDKEAQLKKGIASDYLLPDVALVSPEMTKTMPQSVTAASGIDALVHAIEAYLSVNASPITDALALGAMKMISTNLPKAYANPNDLEAREAMVTASLMAGMAFGNAGVGAVHALAYPLGGRFNLPHGVSNALLLPYVMEWNRIASLERFKEIAEALGESTDNATLVEASEKAIAAMKRLCEFVGIPSSLQEVGINEDAIPAMAHDASQISRLLNNNPRVLREKDIEQIYRAAL